MKAAIYREYGSPDVISVEDIPMPTVSDSQVLVKVHAASINSWDWDLLRGDKMSRLLGGMFKPQYSVLGADIAGEVVSVGKDVTSFKPGDEVFGDLSESGWGGFAEFTAANESALATKPPDVSFEQAAALPQAAVMALQGVRDYGDTQAGEHILVNGAGGGMGTFALQLAKSLGAEVTGVDRGTKFATMQAAGADHVIDYTTTDFTKNGQRYDVILDAACHRSMFDNRRSLSDQGVYVMVGGQIRRLPQVLLLGGWLPFSGDKRMCLLMHEPNKELAFLGELLASGKLVAIIDRSVTLEQLPAAFHHFASGLIEGKIVVTP